MRARAILLATVALVAAGTAAWGARHFLASERAAIAAARPQLAAPPRAQRVLVARTDLPAGTIVQTKHLRWQAWPDATMPEGWYIEGKATPDQLAGTVVRGLVAAGEPVAASRLVHPGEQGFLAAVLAPGLRAVSVSVNATSGIAGFVFPGDRVDLILSHGVEREGGNGRLRRASETVLSDVRVLAVDQSTDDAAAKASPAKTVTLEVSPKDAEKVTLVADLGRLSLSLRSLARDEDGETPQRVAPDAPHTWDSEVSRLLTSPAVQKPQVVRVWRGGELVTQRFGEPDRPAGPAEPATSSEVEP